MTNRDHPPVPALRAFGLGHLTGPEAVAVERHLSECDTCLSHVETVPDDAVVRIVRGTVGGLSRPAGNEVDVSTGCPER